MAKLRNFGVGTGTSTNGIIGEKLTFSNTEKIYAEQVWDNVSTNDLFTIEWYKEVPGQVRGKLIVKHNWTNSAGYSSIYHSAWIKGYGAGSYHVSFLRNGVLEKGIAFKVVSETPPTPPTPPTPKPRVISGIVTTKLLGTPIALAKITFINKSDTTSADGKYSILNPEYMSGLITCSAPGFKTIEEVITAPAEGTLTKNFELEPIAPPAPPEKTWWKKLLELIVNVNLAPFLVSDDLFQRGYKLLTGKEMTDAEFELHRLELSDQILPINLLLKLFTGKNLKGETEEFGSAGDWIELILIVPLFLIPGNADDVAVRIAVKKLTSKEAKILAAKMGEKKIVKALIKTIKAKPSISAKLLAKFPISVRDAVISGLYETAWGKEAVYSLGKLGYWEALKPWWKSTLAKAGLGVAAASLLTGIIGSYPFAGFLKEEALQNLDFGIKAATNNKDAEGLRKAIDQKGELLNPTVWDKIFASIPYANILASLHDFFNAARTKLEIDETTFETKKAEWEEEAAPKGTLIVSPTPADAEVSVDKLPYVKSAFEEIVPVGTYHALVSKFKFTSQNEYLEVKENETTTWNPTLEEKTAPAPLKAKLTISVTPNDAKISVADHPEITKPDIYELLPGSYTLDFSKEGYKSARRTVYLSKGETEIVAVILSKTIPVPPAPPTPPTPPVPPVPKKATITITSEPTNAQVYIDGEYTWATTPYTILLDEGEHIFRVQMKDYYPIEITGEVEANEVSELPFTLEAIPKPEVPAEPYYPQTPYYPTYHPTTPYVPSVVYTPPEEIPPYNYSYLSPELMEIPPTEPVSPPIEEELMINIETTDVKPWKGRIYSIAVLELSKPEAETKVLSGDNEKELINLFLDWFDAGNYKTLVGYNTAFDYRYIFAKMMLYRRPSKAFKEIKLKDVMQIMKQVKEAFVFGYNPTGKLDDWGKMMFGKGKYGAQELMLRKYISGDFDYVRAFQERQIELTKGLYDLARFCSSEAFILPVSTIPEETLSPVLTPSVEAIEEKKTKVCPVCKAYNFPSSKVCEICGASI